MTPSSPQPQYTVSVAAALAGMHAQTLRQYDRLGLVTPSRTKGKGRRYSSSDVERLREVRILTQERGVNLAGVQLALELRNRIEELEEDVEKLHESLRQAAHPTVRVFTADSEGKVRATPPRPSRQGEGEQGLVRHLGLWGHLAGLHSVGALQGKILEAGSQAGK